MTTPPSATDAAPLPPPPERDIHPLRIADFRAFWLSRVCGVLGTSAQSAAIAWQVYDLARKTQSIEQSALYIGLIGLCSFLTLFAFTIPAGIVADRYDRKRIISIVLMLQLALSVCFVLYSLLPRPPIWGLFALSAFLGAFRAFSAPASSALGPMLVPKIVLPRSIAVNSMAMQMGQIVGPALGGVLVGFSPRFAYAWCAVLCLVAATLVLTIKTPTAPQANPAPKMEMMKEGFAYIWSNKVVLGAISLDLFAVLLGGATALMPIFVKDILHAGPEMFGLLRGSPALGAIVMSFALSTWPIRRHAGPWMFGGVAVFGVATIVFGLSTLVWLSILAMIVLGAAIFGGVGSLIVTGLWMKLFPALFKANRLE